MSVGRILRTNCILNFDSAVYCTTFLIDGTLFVENNFRLVYQFPYILAL